MVQQQLFIFIFRRVWEGLVLILHSIFGGIKRWSHLVLGFVVQSLSCVWFFTSPWTVARQPSLSFTISEFAQNSCPLSQWCHPHISSLLPPSPALWSWTFFLRGLTLVMQSPYLILVCSYFLLLPDSYWLVSCFYKFTPFPRLSSLLESNCL